MIGAAGNVATTVAVGLAAMQKKAAAPTGLVTEAPPLSRLRLAPFNSFVLGGHEVSRRTALQTAEVLRRDSGLFDDRLLKLASPLLRAYQRNIRPGSVLGCGDAIRRLAGLRGAADRVTAATLVARFRRDLRSFAKNHRLARVVVVHLASTEPPFRLDARHRRWADLQRALDRTSPPLPASSLYAIAAILEGMPFVSFTPSLGIEVPAIRELAESCGVPIMGSDGKTGETLMKTALAPMFRDRALRIESWVGHNVLGNGDGLILDTTTNKQAKITGKDGVVSSIVGYAPQTRTSIEYVPSFADWKTAWDHVHFRGFLDTQMTLQFVWQGCDSILAAPLVLDLARLADYHARKGRAGVMTHLACFFKSPLGVRVHDFAAQVKLLHDYAARDLAAGRKPR